MRLIFGIIMGLTAPLSVAIIPHLVSNVGSSIMIAWTIGYIVGWFWRKYIKETK